MLGAHIAFAASAHRMRNKGPKNTFFQPSAGLWLKDDCFLHVNAAAILLIYPRKLASCAGELRIINGCA